MQDLDISIDEWAVVFFLSEIESGVIWCSKLWWSFHGGYPFWCLFGGWVEGGCLESISLLKIENRVLKEAGDCSDELDRLLSCFSLVQFFNQSETRFYLKKEGRTDYF